MDPITLVVTAVALGASAGLTETATAAIKDAYDTLKDLLSSRGVDVSGVERKPDSSTQRAALQETLADTGDGVDDVVLDMARKVTEAVAEQRPEAGQVIGVDLRDVQASFLRIGSVASSGQGVKAEQVRLSGGFSIDQIDAGRQRNPPSAR